MKKKILLIDDNYHSSEQGAFLNAFERSFLTKNGYDVYTFSFPEELPSNPLESDFFYKTPRNYLLQKGGKFIGNHFVINYLKNVIKKIDPDIVHCHLISKYPAEVYSALDARIPNIQTLHGPNLFCATSWGCRKGSVPCELGIGIKCYLRGCMTLSETILYNYLDARTWDNLIGKIKFFHCPSRNIMNTALRLGIERVAHIPLGISDTFMNVNRVKPSGDPTIVFVGSLEKCKGVDKLVEAMRIVVQILPKAKLRIAGKGGLQDQLVRRVSELHMNETVEFMGHIPHSSLLHEYSRADVLVIPSVWQEQFGLVGPEAMACGLPCIGSDIGGIPEWLFHGEWGLLVPPGNIACLAAAIIKVLSDRDWAYEAGLAAQTYVRKNYTSTEYGNRLIALFEETMD